MSRSLPKGATVRMAPPPGAGERPAARADALATGAAVRRPASAPTSRSPAASPPPSSGPRRSAATPSRSSSRTPTSGAPGRWRAARRRPSGRPTPRARSARCWPTPPTSSTWPPPTRAMLARSREALADELARCARSGRRRPGAAPRRAPGRRRGGGARPRRRLPRRGAGGAARPSRTRVLLENTAGQGSCLGHRLEHLAAHPRALPAARRRRVGVCIDTCHAFAAGYADPRAPRLARLRRRDRRRGWAWRPLGCIHLNDSLRPFGSRRDRHAHIGEGEIGLEAFARLLAEPALAAVPMIVETEPGKDMAGHRRDLEVLRGLLPHRLTNRGAGPAGASSGRTTSPRPSASG